MKDERKVECRPKAFLYTSFGHVTTKIHPKLGVRIVLQAFVKTRPTKKNFSPFQLSQLSRPETDRIKLLEVSHGKK